MNERKFDLNIEKILEDWEIYHALREIIANAIDEQIITHTKNIEIFKDQNDDWHIKDYGRGLQYEHLTQNENEEKTKYPNIIGKFGVGLKDALATFDRRGIKVIVRSKYGDITLDKSSKQGFDDIITLHACISDPVNPNQIGTDFIISKCSTKDIEKAKQFFLMFSGEQTLERTQYGDVLVKEDDLASIYVNGVKVAEEENFMFSYNITSVNSSIRKALNRERTNVGRAAYSERVKSILLSCTESNVAEKLINDLQNYENGTCHDELKWIDVSLHATKILNSISRAVFMTPSELIQAPRFVNEARSDGYQITTIPENLKEKINGQVDIKGNPIIDLANFQSNWNDSFSFEFVNEDKLSIKEKELFNKINYVLSFVGGKPDIVKEIKISETMRFDESTYSEAVGLWSPPFIIIKRSQLKDEKAFFGTLLHEIAHVRSMAADITIRFENELTAIIGEIISNSILINSNNESPIYKDKKTSFWQRILG